MSLYRINFDGMRQSNNAAMFTFFQLHPFLCCKVPKSRINIWLNTLNSFLSGKSSFVFNEFYCQFIIDRNWMWQDEVGFTEGTTANLILGRTKLNLGRTKIGLKWCNSSFQNLHFLDISNFRNIRFVAPLCKQTTTKRECFQL